MFNNSRYLLKSTSTLMPLIRPTLGLQNCFAMSPSPLMTSSLNMSCRGGMSTFFNDLDEKSRKSLAWAMNAVPEYEKIQRRWKTPLETKKRKQAERAAREAN